MGRKARHPYLRRRGEVWWIRVAVPKALRHLYTSPHVEQSLGTRDVADAERRKLAAVALVMQEFRRKQRAGQGALVEDDEALRYHAELLKAANEDDGDPYGDVALVEGLITDRAEEIEAKRGTHVAKLFAAKAFGKTTIRGAWDVWTPICDLTPGTIAKLKRALDEFLGFLARVDALPNEITADDAHRYVAWLNTKATNAKGEPLDPDTKQARVGSLSTIWQKALERKGLAPKGTFAIWQGHEFTGARDKAVAKKKERPFTPDELIRVSHGPEVGNNATYTKRTMLELTALALYTGARIEELCARKVSDLVPIRGGYTLSIYGGKTRAATRDLPVLHPIPVAIIKRRIGKRTDDPSAYLFPDLVPGGHDNKRSWQVDKAIGRYFRGPIGLPEGVRFHSARANFITVMEEKGIDERWTQRYVGHTQKALIAKVYADPEVLRKVARAIRYRSHVESALKAALGV